MRRLALVPALIAALLVPSGAHALGLGEIEIQSALNQRLDAEIPLRGVPSGQSDDIEVALASEEAFENVGLDRPFALTRLRFTVKQRDGGAHYVHITSRESIVEPFLSFLVEVDWSGGNLLREYTVLLDPPVFTSEEDAERSGGGTDTARTSEAGDDAGVTGEIERDAESAEDRSDASGEETQSASGTGQTGSGGGDQPVFLEVEEREERAERARAEADAERAEGDGGSGSRSAGVPEQYGPVGEGETLWSIASRLRSGDMTVQQMMVALLRYNPDAFGGENINQLKQGYVLRVPDSDRVLEVSAQRALAAVREQNGVWRELQEGSRTQTSVAASEQGSGDAGAAGEIGSGADDAELSIVGADEGGASSDEAASATGSSSADESRKLQLAREQLESTRLEKEELESRVDELEQTVSKMEKLLEVRDERLSALQEELRDLEGRQADGEDADAVADEDAAGDDEDAVDDESVAASGDDADDEDTVAAADGDAADDEDAGAAGTDGTDGGADAEDEAVAGDDTASADATDSADEDTKSTEATASADEQVDADYVPEGKRATEEDRGFQTTRTEEPKETWLDKVNGVVATVAGVFAGVGGGLLGGPVGLGLVAAVVLLGGGLVLMRRRREEAETDDPDGFDALEPETDIAPFDAGSSGQFEAQAADVDEDDQSTRTANAEDAQSALMAEEFDVASLDEEEPADRTDTGGLDEAGRGLDDDEAEKDDTVAEADVYLAYGLHQQAEDLLRLALREQSGNAMYHEKLLETLYASGKTEEFIEEAETFRGLVDEPESRLWQRVLAMGRDLAPNHELFADGDTEYTAADVQPARPAETDLELDDAGGDIDFGLDDEPDNASAGASGPAAAEDDDDDEFSSTMMLDANDFEAIEGDGGLVGPGDDGAQAGGGGTAAADEADEDDDLEFDIGDLDSLTGDEGASAPAASGPEAPTDDSGEIEFDLDDDVPAQSGDSGGAVGEADDDALDFDLDFDESKTPEGSAGTNETDAPGAEVPARAENDDDALDFGLDFDESETPEEGSAGTNETDAPEAEVPASAENDDGGLDFDFDLEETSAESTPLATATDDSGAAEPAGTAEDDPLEIGDLEIGDLDSLEMDSPGEAETDDAEVASAPETAGVSDATAADADAFDLSDLEADPDDGSEALSAEEASGVSDTGDRGPAADDADDAFDLSDLDAAGGAESDDDTFDLDNLGAAEPESPASAESGSSLQADVDEPAAESVGNADSTDAEAAPDEDDEFDTMLDLARAYIDMGDPESATNALEEVASSGNEQQRSEAQSLLESVR